MGVEGVVPTRALAANASPVSLKRHSLQAVVGAQSPLALEELSRRRTSIPPGFTYGSDDHDDDDDEQEHTERRWRSFDVTTSVSSSSRLATLASRIETEREQLSAAEHAARPSRRRRRALFQSFLSSSRKEQIELRRMEMMAQVAKCNRSLVVLRDTLTSLELTAHESSAVDATTTCPSPSLLDEIDIDADAVLAEDCVHHILELQFQFLHRSAELHGDKKLQAPRALSPAIALQQFLNEFVSAEDGVQRVPCAMDAPTPALVRFEKLLARYKVLKPSLKRSLDQLCRDTLGSFTRQRHDQHESQSAAAVWDTRAPQDVLPSLVREIEESVLETARVTDHVRATLRTFIEQMVFSRLAGACYRSLAVELDEQNAQWREQIAKARLLQIDEVGLPVEVDNNLVLGEGEVFSESIDAFNRLPHLVPSSVLGAFLSAVRVLYREAQALLGLSCGYISADVLLPLLVLVLSRTDLPHLHAQVFLMEQFAIDESQEGSEAAYYLACLQAAMGYIMTEVGKTPAVAAQ